MLPVADSMALALQGLTGSRVTSLVGWWEGMGNGKVHGNSYLGVSQNEPYWGSPE